MAACSVTNAVPGYAVAIQTGLAGTGTVNAAAIALTMGGTFDYRDHAAGAVNGRYLFPDDYRLLGG